MFAVSHTPELRSALHRALPELRGVLGPEAAASLHEDLSFAQALARCERLGYEIVAVLDAAVARMSRDWITEGAGMFAVGPAVRAVSGQILLPGGRVAWRGGFRGFGGMAASPDYGRNQADSGYHGMGWCQRNCDAVPSACFFATTELLERAVVALGNKPLTLRELVGALAVEAWRSDFQTVYTPFVQATLNREIAVDPILPREAVSMADRGSRFYHQAFGRMLETAYELTTMDSRAMQGEAA